MAAPTRSIRIPETRVWRGAASAVVQSRSATMMTLMAAQAFAQDAVAASSDSERIMAEHARTFRFATRFLPSDFRDPTIRLYAFFRTLDDLVDESPEDEATRQMISEELDQWRTWMLSGSGGEAPRFELGEHLAHLIERFDIPTSLFVDFLDGLRADMAPQLPETRADVERYSYQVASTVGVSMTYIFGATSHQAIEAATRLGIAMQLTNILRDIGGDIDRSRIYLPKDLLALNGLEPDDIADMRRDGRGPDHRLRAVVQTMVDWADQHYIAGINGIGLLPRDVRLPILIAARLYQQILRQLEHLDYDSLRRRAATGRWQKVQEAYRCALLVPQLDSNGRDRRSAADERTSGQISNEQDRNAR